MVVGGERIIVKVDSEAAKSFVGRRGLGRMRHIEVRDLWLQEEVRNGKVKVEKVKGTENPADLMTKCLSQEVVREHSSSSLSVEFPCGRAETAPALHNVQRTRALWQADERQDEGVDADEMLAAVQRAVNATWLKNWKRYTRAQRNHDHDHNTNHDATHHDHDDEAERKEMKKQLERKEGQRPGSERAGAIDE